jgi:predicted RNase H-like nuclease
MRREIAHKVPDRIDHSRRLVQKSPKKSDQDMLDAVLCALIGFHWRVRPRSESILLGNTATGYMIAPVCAAARERLEAAAARRGVAVDGVIRSEDRFSAADQEAG